MEKLAGQVRGRRCPSLLGLKESCKADGDGTILRSGEYDGKFRRGGRIGSVGRNENHHGQWDHCAVVMCGREWNMNGHIFP